MEVGLALDGGARTHSIARLTLRLRGWHSKRDQRRRGRRSASSGPAAVGLLEQFGDPLRIGNRTTSPDAAELLPHHSSAHHPATRRPRPPSPISSTNTCTWDSSAGPSRRILRAPERRHVVVRRLGRLRQAEGDRPGRRRAPCAHRSCTAGRRLDGIVLRRSSTRLGAPDRPTPCGAIAASVLHGSTARVRRGRRPRAARVRRPCVRRADRTSRNVDHAEQRVVPTDADVLCPGGSACRAGAR
jgi:hypothetical protein